MAKATFHDIAARAGVGTATVERVLNGRGGVRPEMVERVVAAARALDYPRKLPEAHRGILRIEVLMVRPESAFYRRLSRAFERIAATLDATVMVHRTFTEESDPRAIAARIADPPMRRAGLILAVPDHPAIRAAVAEVAARGLPLVHVVTRAAEGAGDVVAIDNVAAGRSAAMLIARMGGGRGPVMALCHPIYQVHRDRIRGFSDWFAAHPDCGLSFDWLGFGRDEQQIGAGLLREALRRMPGLAGLYNAGGGNEALIDLLRRHSGPRPFFVGHELTEESAAALRDGVMDVVLDQAPEAQARRALDLILRRIGLTEIEPDHLPIRFVTITAESL